MRAFILAGALLAGCTAAAEPDPACPDCLGQGTDALNSGGTPDTTTSDAVGTGGTAAEGARTTAGSDDDGNDEQQCHSPTKVCQPAGPCEEPLVCDPGMTCDPTSDRCIECLEDSACNGDRCDLETKTCTECLSNSDCTSPGASQCIAGTCTGCGGSNAACSHLADTQVCAGDTCVQCTGQDYDACGEDPDSGKLRVCDSLANTCSDHPAGETDLCGECVSDAQCKEGQLCVLQDFGEASTGYFCLWQKGGSGGAPASCPDDRPYVQEMKGSESIDGTSASVCTLRRTTCPAYNNIASPDVNCAPAGIPDDALCGTAAGDAYCQLFAQDPDVYFCTVPCTGDIDCDEGTACTTQGMLKACE